MSAGHLAALDDMIAGCLVLERSSVLVTIERTIDQAHESGLS